MRRAASVSVVYRENKMAALDTARRTFNELRGYAATPENCGMMSVP